MRVFLTGATGCVGSRILDRLLGNPAIEVAALARDPSRLRIPEGAAHRVTVVKGDLRDGERLDRVLKETDAAILAATSWGGKTAFDVTVRANVDLAKRLLAGCCRTVAYFSSASVLAGDGSLLPEARDLGTEYIAAKYHLVEEMEQLEPSGRVIGIFPTVVLGGAPGQSAPMSHFARMLHENAKWARLIRFFSASGRFHLIHPDDIAAVTVAGIRQDAPSGPANRLVLGMPAVDVGAFIGEICAFQGRRHRPLISITEGRTAAFAKLVGARLSPWDRYCAENRDQSFPDALMPGHFGLEEVMTTVRRGLELIDFPTR